MWKISPYVEVMGATVNAFTCPSGPPHGFPGLPPYWEEEQRKNPSIRKVIDYVKQGTRPPIGLVRKESDDVKKLLREWDKLEVKQGVLYRRRVDIKGKAHPTTCPSSKVPNISLELTTRRNRQSRNLTNHRLDS